MKFGASFKLGLTLLFLLTYCLASFTPAQAQSEVVLESLIVDIWPEYDKPSVLVIYHITLDASTTLPAEIAIRLPASVGQPHAVAIQDQNGLYNLNYEIAAAGNWEEIRFTTPSQDVRIEFYDPTLTKDGPTRNYIFRWPGDYAVNNMTLQVQQPPTATNISIKPDMGSGRVADDGLTYFTYLAGKVKTGTPFELSISYDKADDELTSAGSFQPVSPSEPISQSPAGQLNFTQMLPWILGGTGLLLIAAGLVWYTRTGHLPQPASSRRRHASTRSTTEDDSPQGGSFCHQCGKRASAGDTFCRACGTKLH